MKRFGDIRDQLVALPHGDPDGGAAYVKLDLFPVRFDLIRRLEPAPRSVFEFGALYGYFLVTAVTAAPSIDTIGWCDNESAMPGSNALLVANLASVRAGWRAAYWRDREEIPSDKRYDLVQIDADHSFGGCLADLHAAEKFQPRWVFLDDWTAHPDVQRAAGAWLDTQPAGRWRLDVHETVNGLAVLTRDA